MNWLGTFIRHGLTVLGTLLIAQGLPHDLVTQFVDVNSAVLTGLLPVLVGVILSLLKANK